MTGLCSIENRSKFVISQLCRGKIQQRNPNRAGSFRVGTLGEHERYVNDRFSMWVNATVLASFPNRCIACITSSLLCPSRSLSLQSDTRPVSYRLRLLFLDSAPVISIIGRGSSPEIASFVAADGQVPTDVPIPGTIRNARSEDSSCAAVKRLLLLAGASCVVGL